jgi:hypothetical protein
MTKSLLSSLKVIARPENTKTNPMAAKREKLLRKLNQQKEMALCFVNDEVFTAYKEKWDKDPETGEKIKVKVPKKVSPWYYQQNNTFFFEVRYANKPLELQEGLQAIEVGAKTNLLPTINTVIEAVISGELDALLPIKTKVAKTNKK